MCAEHRRRAGLCAALLLAAATAAHTQMSIGIFAGMPSSGTVCGSSTTDKGGSGSIIIGNLCPANQAKLNGPRTVYVDSATGNFFIADYTDNELREVYESGTNELGRLVAAYNNSAVVNSSSVVAGDIYNGCGAYSGTFTSISTSGGSCGNTKLSPTGVGLDAGGNIIESEGNRVRLAYIAGTAATTLINNTLGLIGTVSPKNGYEYPIIYSSLNGYYGDGGPAIAALTYNARGVWVDASENVYIADTGSNAIRKITGSTGIITTIAGTGCTQGTVTYQTVGSMGSIPLAVTTAGGCTAAVTGDGGPAASANLSAPYDVAMDTSGNLYIADYGNARVRAIYEGSGSIPGVSSPQLGYIYSVAGGGTNTTGGVAATSVQFSSVSGIGFDASGNLYVADALANQIWKIATGTRIATIIAGGGTTRTQATCSTDGYGDGCVATQAVLNAPQGRIAVDASSSLYFTDASNNMVRVLKPYTQGSTAQSITFPAPSSPVAYNSTPIVLSASAGSGLPVTLNVTGPATLAGTTLTLTGTGTVTITATQAGNAIYATATQVQRTIVVVANGLTVSASGTFSRIFGTANPSYGFSVTGFITPDTQASVVSGVPVITTTATPKSPAGSYPITLTAGTLATSNTSNSYTFVMNAGQTLAVTGSAAQSINFPPLANYSKSSNIYFPLAAYATSGLPVAYTVNSGPATVIGTNLYVTGTGAVSVTASQVGNTSFAAATPVTRTFNAAATNCNVFDNSYFQGKPSVVDTVLTRSDVVYSSKIWTGGTNTATGELTLPTRASFDTLMASSSYGDAGPLVLDIEEIGLQSQAAETVLQTIAQWAHQDRPGRIIGFYGYNVFDAVTTASSNFSLAQQLAQYVDAFFPEAYTNYADYQETSWLAQEQTRIANARAIGPGKPIYPYIWPIYYGSTLLDQSGTNIAGTYVDSTYWNYELTNLYPISDGVVVWSSSSNVWSDTTGWWEVTQTYVTNSCP